MTLCRAPCFKALCQLRMPTHDLVAQSTRSTTGTPLLFSIVSPPLIYTETFILNFPCSTELLGNSRLCGLSSGLRPRHALYSLCGNPVLSVLPLRYPVVPPAICAVENIVLACVCVWSYLPSLCGCTRLPLPRSPHR